MFSIVGDLSKQINFWRDKGELVPEALLAFVMHQILSGLGFVHQLDLFHRDLKP